MSYIVNWTKTGTPPDGKPAITLPPLFVDSTSTSLTLTGKGTPNYGEIQQENFIRLLENFASDTAPAHATHGQIWFKTTDHSLYFYDTDQVWKRIGGIFKGNTAPTLGYYEGDLWWDMDDNKLYVYDGTDWQQVWPSLAIVPVAYVEEYNKLVDLYNRIGATPSGTTYATAMGYGQDLIPHATIANMTNQLWLDLMARFKKLAQHQGTDTSLVPTRGFILDKSTVHGVVTALSEYGNLLTVANLVEANIHNFNPMSFESSILANASYTRTSSYFYAKSHEMVATFNSEDHMKAFFNAGGKFQLNQQFTPSQSTAFNTSWQQFVSAIGNVVFNAEKTAYSGATGTTYGFYDLTSTYKTLFYKASTSGASRGAWVKIEARLENNNTAIRFKVTFCPEGVNHIGIDTFAYTSSTYAAIGSTLSSMTTFKPNNANLNVQVMSYPSVSGGGTFITDTTV